MYLGLTQKHLNNSDVSTWSSLSLDSEYIVTIAGLNYQTISKKYDPEKEGGIVESVDDSPELYNIVKVRYPKGSVGNDQEFDMTVCTNKNDEYIGDLDTAKFLCDKKGIEPQLAKPSNQVCSIGYCKKERKWYGWSHRAMYGFKPGSKVYPGHCAFKASSMKEFREAVEKEYADGFYKDKTFETTRNGIKVAYSYEIEDGPRKGQVIKGSFFHKFNPGKGSWVAKDNGDAKRMAMDFAESVSSVSVEDFELALTFDFNSESANQDVSKYVWFKYNSPKISRLAKHNRWHKIDVEKGDVIGFKQNLRNKKFSMISREDPSIVFSLERKDVKRIIDKSKPYNGKVLNIKVTPGDEEFAKIGVKTVNKKPKSKIILDQTGAPKKLRRESQEMVHAVIFKADESKAGFILGVASTLNKAKKIAQTRASKEVTANITTMLLPKDNGLVKRALRTGWTRLSEQQTSTLYGKGLNLRTFNLER